jgi:hypothetical protein
MDSGNGSPGPFGKINFHLYLPAELAYIIREYQRMTRQDTMTATIRHLLETHPELTKTAEKLYTDSTGS